MDTKILQDSNLIVSKVASLSAKEITELYQAARETIADNMSFSHGFNYPRIPEEEVLRRYFLGAMLVPEREQYICKLNGIVAGYLELLKASSNQITKTFAAEVVNHFVAPWARGTGIARKMLFFAEHSAKKAGISVIKLSVRETQVEARNLYEKSGYIHWGSCTRYEKIDERYIVGHYFYKEL